MSNQQIEPQAEVDAISFSGVTEDSVDPKWAAHWDELTALQKIAISEGREPGPRPLSQAEREAGTGTPSEAIDGEPSALQRIAQLEAEANGTSKKDVKEDTKTVK